MSVGFIDSSSRAPSSRIPVGSRDAAAGPIQRRSTYNRRFQVGILVDKDCEFHRRRKHICGFRRLQIIVWSMQGCGAGCALQSAANGLFERPHLWPPYRALQRRMDLLRRTIPLTTPALNKAGSDCDARHLRGHLRQPAARSDGGGAAQHASEPARAVLPGRHGGRGADDERLSGAARRACGAHARAQAAGRAGRSRSRRPSPPSGARRRRWSIPRSCRSRGSPTRSSTASRPRPRRSPTRSRNISAPTCCSTARRSPMAWSRCSAGTGTRWSTGRATRSARASCSPKA